jgi:stage III sporulation protein AC
METELLFRIAAVGIIVTVLNLILTKSDRAEYGLLITVAGLVTVLALVVNEIGDLFDTVRSVFGL